jgi:hypothetical protein
LQQQLAELNRFALALAEGLLAEYGAELSGGDRPFGNQEIAKLAAGRPPRRAANMRDARKQFLDTKLL